MRILVIGGTGTIGREIVAALAPRHEVISASRRGEVRVDVEDPASVRSLLARIGPLDAVVSAAGALAFRPLAALGDDDFALGLRSKLMGQVNVARAAVEHLRDGGSITLTSGVLARHPAPGSASAALCSSAIEGFVRAAALELPRGIRINAVSPPWVRETLAAMGLDPAPGKPAAEVARAYVASIEGLASGTSIDA